MQKRGQFFLIAALVMISIVLSFSSIYNSASSQKSDYPRISYLAQALKNEGLNIINNGYYHNKSSDFISNNLKDFSRDYSSNNQNINFTILVGNSSDSSSFKYYTHRNGILQSDSSGNAQVLNKVIKITLNNQEYTFTVTKGYNFHVIAIEEADNEKFVAVE